MRRRVTGAALAAGLLACATAAAQTGRGRSARAAPPAAQPAPAAPARSAPTAPADAQPAPGSAAAASAEPWLVLPLGGDAVAARRVETWVVDGLIALGRPAQLGSLPLDDTLMALGCMERTAECLNMVAEQLGAGGVVFGEAAGGDPTRVALSGYDAGKAEMLAPTEFSVAGDDASPVTGALKELLRLRAEGRLRVTANVAGVAVTIDGEPRGLTPLTLAGLAEGRYHIEAAREGYRPWSGDVTVVAGVTAQAAVEMQAEQPTALFDLGRLRARTWIAAGAGAAALAAGGVFGALYASAQKSADTARVASYDDLRGVSDDLDRAERFALLANVGFAVGGAALVAAGVLAWLDMGDPGDDVDTAFTGDGLRVRW